MATAKAAVEQCAEKKGEKGSYETRFAFPSPVSKKGKRAES